MRSVVDIVDLTPEEIDGLIETAQDIIKNPEKYQDKCKNKKTGFEVCFKDLGCY